MEAEIIGAIHKTHEIQFILLNRWMRVYPEYPEGYIRRYRGTHYIDVVTKQKKAGEGYRDKLIKEPDADLEQH